ncbi:MAG: M23 family metallopeptidase [Brevefilum sp.]|nr:M23 family metallopeptidase [Brevefilum sp.]
MKKRTVLTILGISVAVMLGVYVLYRSYFSISQRARKVFEFLRNPQTHQGSVILALTRCGDAPFVLPTTGLVGFLWDDSFRPGHRHQGIDIFSGTGVGETPVYAAYEGYLTRLPEWKSSVIIRIPSDPLQPGRQIWTYYTHMADESGVSLIVEDFPAGTSEVWVEAGTLLGFQGNFSGTPDNPTGVHLHFSMVKDDGQGKFVNELEIGNTLDPSPYFGMVLNGKENSDHIPACP